MGLVRRYKITCDECGDTHEGESENVIWGFSSPQRARTVARQDGWGRVPYSRALFSPRRDLCPTCLEKYTEGAV